MKSHARLAAIFALDIGKKVTVNVQSCDLVLMQGWCMRYVPNTRKDRQRSYGDQLWARGMGS
jgi:hypothetical protein